MALYSRVKLVDENLVACFNASSDGGLDIGRVNHYRAVKTRAARPPYAPGQSRDSVLSALVPKQHFGEQLRE